MNQTRLKLWIPVIFWTAAIYGTVYVARPISNMLLKKTPLGILINIALLAILMMLGFIIIKKIQIRKPSSYILLSIIGLCYLIGLRMFWIPAEKIHFLEYGLLAFLIFRALAFDRPPWQAYAAALILTILIGWGDECLQSITPGRYYQFPDVMLNAASGVLELLLTFVARREQKPNCQFGMR